MAYPEQISTLLAQASHHYALHSYDQSTSLYSEVCSIYSSLNSCDDPLLLFLYGKSLFQLAVLKSDVFAQQNVLKEEGDDGDEAALEDDSGNFQFVDGEDDFNGDSENQVEGEVDESGVDGEVDESKIEGDSSVSGAKGADEEVKNDVYKADNEDENASGADSGEFQSDFEEAWEILDLTRSLWEKELETVKSEADTLTKPYSLDPNFSKSKYISIIKNLAETYDILGEVSLEAENFSQSATDLKKSLDLRRDIYPNDSSLISESYYKLSLALEFCIDQPNNREEAKNYTKLAIDSIKLRNINESDDLKKKDNLELIKDLQDRFNELDKDPNEDIKIDQLNVLKGILGQATGESKEVDPLNVKRKVNDLSANVKKRKKDDK